MLVSLSEISCIRPVRIDMGLSEPQTQTRRRLAVIRNTSGAAPLVGSISACAWLASQAHANPVSQCQLDVCLEGRRKRTDRSLASNFEEHTLRGSLSRVSQAKTGGAERDRTDDLKLAKLALSQLSYSPDLLPLACRSLAFRKRRVVESIGIEPTTSSLQSSRSPN